MVEKRQRGFIARSFSLCQNYHTTQHPLRGVPGGETSDLPGEERFSEAMAVIEEALAIDRADRYRETREAIRNSKAARGAES